MASNLLSRRAAGGGDDGLLVAAAEAATLIWKFLSRENRGRFSLQPAPRTHWSIVAGPPRKDGDRL